MLVTGAQQFYMKKDFYSLALLEWRKAHPFQRRASDMSNEDREWVINRARELSQQ